MADPVTSKPANAAPTAPSQAPSAATPEADIKPAGPLAKPAAPAPTLHIDAPPPMPIRPHGTGVRGLTLSRGSQLFEGRFGRMFRALPPADFGDTDEQTGKALQDLATAMVGNDPPKDGPDAEESGIPAVYTYFGQFIDHDLTFDPSSSLQKQSDPEALVDFRTPRFDLDNIYGRGKDDDPYFYDKDGRFLLGQPLSGAKANPKARDLPRSQDDPARAVIGDPRNDENTIVSQLQGLFHRFHNAVFADLAPQGYSFEEIQREVRWHYQWVVINDFLPTLVQPDVLAAVLPHVAKKTDILRDKPTLAFYRAKRDAFMPLEFSVAAYRFGHSMVRPGYRLSETVGVQPVFTSGGSGLTGFRAFPKNWAIDWALFADVEPRDSQSTQRTQLAYRIDTSLVGPLGALPDSVGANPNSLALRNLLRGWRLRLPSGQDVARAMGVPVLRDEEILIGKFTLDRGDIDAQKPITTFGKVFADNCPLWVYVLAETRLPAMIDVTLQAADRLLTIKTPKLGPVGGRIVAETFAGIMLADSSSYLSQFPLWKPRYGKDGIFRLRDLIAKALAA
ncbi:peroxidase family protein [Lichenibacterium dinghuense]|uniref:peroxidase family protein n=1 Tax=Lichenibacterium dinghuense TaxID=2895977 RepID=UPI001F1722BE|nr:heme peroxidase family protein [Lichenibacterium sp. 6Y81]